MNLSDFIHEVWKDERIKALGIRKDEVDTIVKVIIDQIIINLFKHGKVKLRGLFTLSLRKVKGRKIGKIGSGEVEKIDDYYKLGVDPSIAVKEKLEEIRYQ